MPAQERSLRIDGRGLGGDQSYSQRQHREAMARNTSPKAPNPRADAEPSQWDDAVWDQDQDEAAGHRARRLLSRSNSGFHRLGDRFGGFRRWLAGERWVKRLAVVVGGVDGDLRRLASAGCGGGSAPVRSISIWRRHGWPRRSRKISATAIPSRSAAPRSSAPAASASPCASAISSSATATMPSWRRAPKAEVRLSGTALLMGRLRAESLNLVDAELAVRITPDGTVTVSTGDTAKPLATGVASKKDAGLAPTFPRPVRTPAAGTAVTGFAGQPVRHRASPLPTARKADCSRASIGSTA